jgi:hypothetical protein
MSQTHRDAEACRLLQAQELLLRFKEIQGRDCESIEELEAWLKRSPEQAGEKPIVPPVALGVPAPRAPDPPPDESPDEPPSRDRSRWWDRD